MKAILALVIIAGLLTGCSLAQLTPLPIKPWNATVKVVGEDGLPIGGANVLIGYTIPPYAFTDNPKYNGKFSGQTDTNGIYAAKHDDRSDSLGFSVQKSGYYSTHSTYRLGDPEQYVDRRNISLTLTLKKIGQPIAMHAKRQEMKIQKEDEAIGFDLKAGDWVTPNGKGNHEDLYFTAHRKIYGEHEYDCNLTVTFPNKGDGLAVASTEPDGGSEFKTSRTAALDGYQPKLSLQFSNTNQPPAVFGYFIRVRTVLDDNGKVKSALYGKIPGNFRFFAGTKAPKAGMAFTYYLNPTANDRNVEFDLGRNLIRDLRPEEEVKTP